MSRSSDEKPYPDFNRAARFRTSWTAAVEGFAETLMKLRSFKEMPEDQQHQLINVSSGKYVYHCQYGKWDFAYKTQQGKTFWRYLFRPSLPLREARHYAWLHDLKIPAPDVLALGDTRHNFILEESFIITSFIQNTHDGRIFMPGGRFRNGYEALRKTFCIGNLKLLARLHQAKLFHKAAHPRNFLFRGDSPENIEIFWIDVARMRKMKSKRGTVIKDLHTFFRDMQLPRPEVLELIDIYLQEWEDPPFDNAESLLHELVHFKRRLFSQRKYRIFGND